MNPEYTSRVKKIESRVKTLLNHLGSAVGVSGECGDDIEDVLGYSGKINDALCSNIDTYMSDTMYAMHMTMPQTTNVVPQQAAAFSKKGFVSFMTSSGEEKPQLQFADAVDNSNTRFMPKFDSLYGVADIDVDAFRKRYIEALQAGDSPPHPLAHVLDCLADLYPEDQLVPPNIPMKPDTIENTELRYIDRVEELQSLAEILSEELEIAVDLEAHNYRSFQGFCCLMQLSIRKMDIIVDVLQLRKDIGRYLGPIFANPKVLKVFHGSRSDLLWLQRDFGIYVCNLFDTGVASKILGYESHGLAHLLEKHCGFKADKKWQLADWRIRPLQNEAIHYARADTHWLLYCYDILRIELSKLPSESDIVQGQGRDATQGIVRVLEESKEMCYSLYEKEMFTEDSFYDLYKRMENKSGVLTERQLSVFAAMYKWRDTLARELDESPGYILPRGQLFHLAVKSPTSKRALDQTLRSKNQILLTRRDEILYLIDKALKDTADARKAQLGEIITQSSDIRDTKVDEVLNAANNTIQNTISPDNLYGTLGIKIDGSGIGVLGSSTLGTMQKNAPSRKRMVDFTPTPTATDLIIPEREVAPPPPNVPPAVDDDTKAEEDDECLVVEQPETLPLGTLDDEDFLPLPISKLNTKNRGPDKRGNKASDGSRGMKRKKMVPASHIEQESPKRSSFDPEKALNKYSFGKKQRNGGRGRGGGGRGRDKSARTEEEYGIPTGMFNPLSGLLEGKSSSKRSATQVRSGNRSSTYRKR